MPAGYRHTPEAKAKIAAARTKLTPEQRKAAAKKRIAEWAANNPERAKAIKRRSYEKHREQINARRREQNKTPERKAFMREYAPSHKAQNPGMYLAYANNRRALKLGATGSHTDDEWRTLVAYFKHACVYCGRKTNLTRDHVIPLSRTELSPTNDIGNILPACGRCNSQKGDKTDWEYRLWMFQTGGGSCCASA